MGAGDMPLLANIASGKYDKDRIIQSCQNRKADLIWDCQPGDKVKFSQLIRPAYLRGVTGTIRTWNRTRVVVDLDSPHGRFYRGIRCTPQLLIPIEP